MQTKALSQHTRHQTMIQSELISSLPIRIVITILERVPIGPWTNGSSAKGETDGPNL